VFLLFSFAVMVICIIQFGCSLILAHLPLSEPEADATTLVILASAGYSALTLVVQFARWAWPWVLKDD
jgi:hypothetical protein